MQTRRILLSHGSGARPTYELIRRVFVKEFSNPILNELLDSAALDYKQKLAFTTDSFVVSPLFFPGGDIGKLAVCGTVNDLVMLGAKPEYLALAMIAEEGLEYRILERVTQSISAAAKVCGVLIVTGDFKVVEAGACDKIFINTSGLGRIIVKKRPSFKNIEPADKIIITGALAEHGLAVLGSRGQGGFAFNIKSDCQALNRLIIPILRRTAGIKFMRDPTRGGLSAALNEIASGSGLAAIINEKDIPVSGRVRAAAELLGIDPLNLANEGKAVIIAHKSRADFIVGQLRKHPLGRRAAIIGAMARGPAHQVILRTAVGGERIVEMAVSEVLPRIC